MTAYCGHAVSFGGKWFGGLARSGSRTAQDHKNQKNNVLRKANAIRPFSPILDVMNFFDVDASGFLMYLDPPYAGRTKAHNFN